jgi:perosamine synthetase
MVRPKSTWHTWASGDVALRDMNGDAKGPVVQQGTSGFLPVAAPMLVGNEKKYVLDCLDSTWISSGGKYTERFEAAFAEFCGVHHAISCSNGTAALHLALMALGVGPGDEVIVPSLTFVATANAVIYCGARPVLADCDPGTWTIDADDVEAKITPRTRGIVAVHLYGHPADMDAMQSIARRHGLFVVEDAAEAHGAMYKGRRVGGLGNVATFSFYGNKIMTTGEGGMVVTDDPALADKIRDLSGHWMYQKLPYWVPIIGYNYRMTDVTAAIGLAQLEQADWHLRRRLEVAALYREHLRDLPWAVPQTEAPWAGHAYWMFSILLSDRVQLERDDVIAGLRARGIETRPIFYPIHLLPPYRRDGETETMPVAEKVAARGITLPTWAGLTPDDVQRVCSNLADCVR